MGAGCAAMIFGGAHVPALRRHRPGRLAAPTTAVVMSAQLQASFPNPTPSALIRGCRWVWLWSDDGVPRTSLDSTKSESRARYVAPEAGVSGASRHREPPTGQLH